jgi:hypothetical protein
VLTCVVFLVRRGHACRARKLPTAGRMVLKHLPAVPKARPRARNGGEDEMPIAQPTARPGTALSNASAAIPNAASFLASHRSRITTHRRSTRHNRPSRTARKSLKTKGPHSPYPAPFLSQSRARATPRLWRPGASAPSAQRLTSSIQKLTGTPERLELDVTRCKSTAMTLLIGTDPVPELHRCYTPPKFKQRRRVRT